MTSYPLTSYLFTFNMNIIYICYSLFLNLIMNNYSPFILNKFMFFYNSFQILFNSYIVYGFLFTNNYEFYIYIHYLSKYIDYIDTFIIILRKKQNQFTFLHLFHHSTVGIIWAIVLNSNVDNEISYFGCLINSFIHSIMYSHYLYTSFGLINPYKKIITNIQIIQFYLCIFHSIYILNFTNNINIFFPFLQIFYSSLMIILFDNYYKNKYLI